MTRKYRDEKHGKITNAWKTKQRKERDVSRNTEANELRRQYKKALERERLSELEQLDDE